MRVATLVFSIVGCATSIATLAVVLVGAKRVDAEMTEMKTKSNQAFSKLKQTINNIDI